LKQSAIKAANGDPGKRKAAERTRRLRDLLQLRQRPLTPFSIADILRPTPGCPPAIGMER
jgi:hypothetical protein